MKSLWSTVPLKKKREQTKSNIETKIIQYVYTNLNQKPKTKNWQEAQFGIWESTERTLQNECNPRYPHK